MKRCWNKINDEWTYEIEVTHEPVNKTEEGETENLVLILEAIKRETGTAPEACLV